MVDADRKQLSGTVKVDKTLAGGLKQGEKRVRCAEKSIVAITIEIKAPKGLVVYVCGMDLMFPGTV